MNILVVDGQGGKIGAAIITELKKTFPEGHGIWAVGTNSAATSAMLKAGAAAGATGEHPVVVNAGKADVILGTVGIVIADSLMGEVTPKMAQAIGQSNALRVLIPFNKCRTYIAGGGDLPISDLIASAVKKVQQLIENEK